MRPCKNCLITHTARHTPQLLGVSRVHVVLYRIIKPTPAVRGLVPCDHSLWRDAVRGRSALMSLPLIPLGLIGLGER